MGIKLVAIDMDGTTLNSDVKLDKQTRDTIIRAIDAGVDVVPCTGRVFSQLPKDILDIPGLHYAITANGARVIDVQNHNKALYLNPMARDEMDKMIAILSRYELFIEAYINGKSYMEQKCMDHPGDYGVPEEYFTLFRECCEPVADYDSLLAMMAENPVEKINIFCADMAIKAAVMLELKGKTKFIVTTSLKTNMEINDATSHKGDGLSHLCQKLGIGQEEVMAVGDSNNDYTMLQYAGLAVAMENGNDNVKQMADFITKTNDELGLAYAMDKFLFKH